MQFVSKNQHLPLFYHIIFRFAAILFIAHIWPPGRAERCKIGKGERHVKHIKHLQSPTTLGKHIKNVKHIKHLHPPSESNIAPPSLSGPKWPTPPQWQANIHLLPTSSRRGRIYICFPHIHLAPSSIAVIRRPLLPSKAHSSSTPVFHRQGEVRGF